MPYVDLPALNLIGNWIATPGERTLVARFVPALPGALPPGADVGSRWNRLAQTLTAIKDGLLADRALSWAGRAQGHETPQGQLDTLIMPHYLMQALTSRAHIVEWINAGRPEGRELLASELDRLEPEVARLRTLLAEVAAEG